MVLDVYIDILFLVNFSMDYLCIFICSKVLHRRISARRMILASVIGGVWSILSLFLPIGSWWEVALDSVIGVLICTAAFAERRRSLVSLFSTALLFVGISMMMGGCMTAIFNLLNKLDLPLSSVSADGLSTYLFAVLAAIAGLISLKSGQVISKKGAVRECKLYIKFCGFDFEFIGFSDSGNLVRDPLSGRAVIFIDRSVIEKQLSLDFLDSFLEGYLTEDAPCKNLRLISLKTACGNSLAVAALPESIRAEFETGKNKKTVSAKIDALISPSDIGTAAGDCTAIVPAEILKV